MVEPAQNRPEPPEPPGTNRNPPEPPGTKSIFKVEATYI